ncbi:MAG: InlB B-repeat-containing protein, partial [Leptospirales bacterium]|nr:InlB B-repeat-containing protein [Leptospirales bacterium]
MKNLQKPLSYLFKRNFLIALFAVCSLLIACGGGTDNSGDSGFNSGDSGLPGITPHTIIFDANGGSGGPISRIITYGDPMPDISTQPAPTRAGYYFAGYYDARIGGTMYYAADMTSVKTFWDKTSDTILYAQWTLTPEFTIIFHKNDGSGDTYTQNAPEKTTAILIRNLFIRAGYTFTGWSTTPSGSVAYADKANYTIYTIATSIVNLYAVWTGNSYTVTFDTDSGGSGGPTSIGVTYGNPMPDISTQPAPTRAGYYFGGYYDAQTGGTMYYAADMTSVKMSWDKTSNTTLYARWTLIPEFTIIFHKNDGNGDTYTQNAPEKTNVILKTNTFTREGYTFTGWSTTPSGSVAYANKANYTIGTSNVNLYAVWTGNSYSVTFDTGSGGPTSIGVTYGDPMPDISTQPAPTRAGYYFGGYYDAQTGGTMYYAADMTSVKMSWDKTSNTTLYARWTLIPEFTIIFNKNDGSGDTYTQNAQENTNVILMTNTFTQVGYTFTGWSTTPSGSVAYANKANYTIGTSNVNLYAVWTGNSYIVAFNANKGSGGPSSVTATYGSPMPSLSGQIPPTRVGLYAFTGYFGAATGGTMYYNSNLTSARNWDKTSNTTLYAQWEEIEFEMVLIPAGTFQMGSPTTELYRRTDETQHSVTLTTGFYMGKYQVTQEQYFAVMGTNPSDFNGEPDYWSDWRDTPPGEIQGKRPVENVSWYDAIVFCNKLSMIEGLTPAYSINGSTNPAVWGTVPTSSNDATWDAVSIVSGSTGYRLPTEAQWEYACRAGTTTAYNTNSDTIDDMTGWY